MGVSDSERTHGSLLGRLSVQPADESAWRDFARQYGPGLVRFGVQHGLNRGDAEEVAQRVFAKLAVVMRTFVYDPSKSFRAWLRTLAHHAWSDFLAEQRRWLTEAVSPAAAQALQEQASADRLGTSLEEEYDRELLEIALVRVRQKVEPRTWRIFERLAFKDDPVAEVAAAEELTIGTAYRAKSRFQQLLTDELKRLEGE